MKFLNENNPVVHFFTIAANLIILNWLLVLGCVPVITAGASISAVHTVCLQIIRQEESGILIGYFRAFQKNFRQATILWLFFLLTGAILAADFFILLKTALLGDLLRSVILIAAGLLTALWLILWVNAFPLQARYDNTVTGTLKNSLVIGIAALPVSILMVLLRLSVFYLAVRWPGTVPALLIASMFILFSGIIYLSDWMAVRTYNRMLPESRP